MNTTDIASFFYPINKNMGITEADYAKTDACVAMATPYHAPLTTAFTS